MFWDRERDNKEPNGGPPCGQVRILLVGDLGNFWRIGSIKHLVFGTELEQPMPRKMGADQSSALPFREK
ncbi:hypothetical protein LguiA_005179 [Lonicera macranthoides]